MSLEGRQLGRYKLCRLLGSGGMGEVYLAEDPQIDNRQIAIKVISAEISPYPNMQIIEDATRLFRHEAQAIASLDHLHVLPLYDFGEANINGTKVTYLVTPFRQEGSFANWLRHRTSPDLLPLENIAYFISQMAEALQYVHDHHIVHRDVKPSNFLIRENKRRPLLPDLILADFGISQIMGPAASVSVRGTPNYMAPEQWEGHPVPATDQYALATIAYELLTGQTVFQGTMQQVMFHHLNTQPQSPNHLNHRVPPTVDAVLLRALAKRPEDRYPSVSIFANTFCNALLDESTVIASPPPMPSPTPLMPSPTPLMPSPTPLMPSPTPPTPSPTPSMPSSTPPYIDSTPNLPVERPGELGSAGTPPVQTPYYPPPPYLPPGGRNGQRLSMPMIITLSALALLLIISGTIITFLWRNNAEVVYHEHETATALSRANASATAQSLTATAAASLKTVLNDPLGNNGQGNAWQESDNCKFVDGAYQATTSEKIGYVYYCTSNWRSLSNFAFQVRMKIVQGDCGGFVFRKGDSTGYVFEVCQDGKYTLYVRDSSKGLSAIRGGNSSLLDTGLGQTNQIAVIANGSNLGLLINEKPVIHITDSTYSQGFIGVVAGSDDNPTTVRYTDALVEVPAT